MEGAKSTSLRDGMRRPAWEFDNSQIRIRSAKETGHEEAQQFTTESEVCD
jgi:hypothetical protein